MLDWLAPAGRDAAPSNWERVARLHSCAPTAPPACPGALISPKLRSNGRTWSRRCRPSSNACSPSRMTAARRASPPSPPRWSRSRHRVVRRLRRAARSGAALLDYDDLIGAQRGAAGRSRRRLGALQTRRRARPPAARRGAGHGPRAMAHRRRADRGILRRPRRARGRGAPCSPSATASSRSSRSRAPTPTNSSAGASAGTAGSRRPARRWRDVELDVSFRSTAPVLALVDAVFDDPVGGRGRGRDPAAMCHMPAAPVMRVGWSCGRSRRRRTRPAGRAVARAGGEPARPQPACRCSPRRSRTGSRTRPAAEEMREQPGRPLRPGDVLVLVRRRNDFARALVRALKARGVQVAGLDRLVLTDQPAVADLLALGDALLLPEDDLALACVLTSPLGGLTDDSLMALAIGRDRLAVGGAAAAGGRAGGLGGGARLHRRPAGAGGLRDAARAVQRGAGAARRPRAAVRAAGAGGGGTDRRAAERGAGLCRAHPPSLQGFVHWLRQSGAEVKREAEGAGDAVRVMTVHGAKGLQAPLVILPDTTALPPRRERRAVGRGRRSARLGAAERGLLRRRRSAARRPRGRSRSRSTTGCSTSP